MSSLLSTACTLLQLTPPMLQQRGRLERGPLVAKFRVVQKLGLRPWPHFPCFLRRRLWSSFYAPVATLNLTYGIILLLELALQLHVSAASERARGLKIREAWVHLCRGAAAIDRSFRVSRFVLNVQEPIRLGLVRDLSLASMQTFLSWVISFWAVLLKKVPENWRRVGVLPLGCKCWFVFVVVTILLFLSWENRNAPNLWLLEMDGMGWACCVGNPQSCNLLELGFELSWSGMKQKDDDDFWLSSSWTQIVVGCLLMC